MIPLPFASAPQSAMPAGLLSLLTNTGLVRSGGEAGFDALIAAAPQPAATTTATTMPTSIAAISTPISSTPTSAVYAEASAGQAAATPTTMVEPPMAVTDTAAVNDAAELVTNATATGRARSASAAKPNREAPTAIIAPDETAIAADTGRPVSPGPTPAAATTEPLLDMVDDQDAASYNPATVEPASPAQGSNWVATVIAATPAADKSAAPLHAAANPPRHGASQQPGPIANGKPAQSASAATPALTTPEVLASRPAETPSMTVFFAQPMMETATSAIDSAAPAQIAERLLDLDSDGAWIDQLARDIAATRSDTGDISFRLLPRHLGRLDIAMRQGDDGLNLRMDTQHEATATIVTSAQTRLVEDLRQQGVRVANSEVTWTPGESGRSLHSQSQGQSQSQGRAAPDHPSHLIETATDGAEAREPGNSQKRPAERGGRFA